MSAEAQLRSATKVLQDAGIDGAARDARRLMAHVLRVDPARLSLVLSDPLRPGQIEAFETIIAARARRVPVSHLTGVRAFYGREFEVGADVLDPRPETETLVSISLSTPFVRLLDLGTGSGCILISLLAERGAEAFGIGTDLSQAALAIAERNAARHRVRDRIQFHVGDWFAALPPGQVPFDLIVSNPPYIAADEMAGLAPEVRDYEPRMALTDEGDGLSAYARIIVGAPRHLTEGGWLRVEIGMTQAEPVIALMQQEGFENLAVARDLDGRDRVISGQKPRNG